MSITSERLKQLRKQKDMSQEEVAKNIGISRTAYVNYEAGRSRPVRKLKELADLFNVSTDYLLGQPESVHVNEKGIFKNKSLLYQKTDETSEYYHDPKVARLAQELKENPGLHVLMDASRGLKKESIEEVKRFIEFQKAKELGDFD